MRRIVVLIFIVNLISSTYSQQITQTFRGAVVDKQTQSPLPGTAVIVMGSTIAVTTDVDGKFSLDNLGVGRLQIKFIFTGYKEKNIGINLTSGKQTVLTIELEENVSEIAEVTVTGEIEKSQNKNATVSARQFSIEDAQRYAGSRNDPARMAANFAGVSGANDSRNDIIIRGNSPLGVLWRLNGIDIPNPNHFGSLGSTGGPISILNTNSLDNSAFFSGAFPAEYGNAIAGVFDLKMRPGNNEKYEFLGQIGFNGFELGGEGPFSKKNKNASFLFNYRYSTLEVFKALGINFGTGSAVPQYQDLTFNAVFPTKKFGKFQFYGVGGLSYISLPDSEKDKSENLYGYSGQDTWYWSNVGFAGMSHTLLLNSNSYTRFNFVASLQSNKIIVDKIDTSFSPVLKTPFYRNESANKRLAANFTYYKKFNAKNNMNCGIYADIYNVLLVDSFNRDTGFVTLRDFNGVTTLLQTQITWQHKFSNQVVMNTGIHWQRLLLNSSETLEPRAGLRWNINAKHALSWGLGLHSQMQPLYVYFSSTQLPNGTRKETNRNIGFTQSAQAVMAHDVNLGKSARIKTEIYYQYIFNAPVKINPSYFSALNLGADFNSPNVDSLINEGSGKNYGVELTIEKFFSRGYYYLVTGSLFNSTYRASDNVWRNTAFNGNYVFNKIGRAHV